MSHEITIAFLNYNTADELLQALATVSAAAENVSYRLVVIDNNSSDDSVARLEASEIEFDLLALKENLGFAAAFNKIFDYSDTPYYLLLNSDILLPPNSITQMLYEIDKVDQAGIAGMTLVRENGTLQTSYYPMPTLLSELTNRTLCQRFYQPKLESATALEVECIIGAVMLVPRTTVEKAGKLDQRFFFFLEETDWCRRIAEAGLKVLYFPEIKVTHLQGRSANKVPIKARVEFHRSRMIYFDKHYGKLAKAILWVGSLLRLVINWLAYLIINILTLGQSNKQVNKFKLYSGVLRWYLKGTPESGGLRPANKREKI